MNKFKYFISGVLIGSIFVGGVSAFANPEIPKSITKWVKLKVNGITTNENSAFVYDNKTYVPVRFISEQLGAEVGWDKYSSTVSINKPIPEQDENNPPVIEPEVKPEDSTPKPSTPAVEYKKLPQSSLVGGANIEVYSISHRNNHTYVYLKIKNTAKNPVQLISNEAYLETSDGTYKQANVAPEDYFRFDQTWYNDIREDETREGYILLPSIPKNINQGTLHLKVLQNDGSKNERESSVNIEWEN